ncbi:4225_t:CDS:1, partial [Diversispora eburnea]
GKFVSNKCNNSVKESDFYASSEESAYSEESEYDLDEYLEQR